jgi:hypothetical protein
MKADLELAPRASQREKLRLGAVAKPAALSRGRRSVAGRIFELQRIIGNQAIQGLLRSVLLQAKLEIGKRHDLYGKNADLADAAVPAGTDQVTFFRSSDSLASVPSDADVPKEYPAAASSTAGFDPGAVVGGETASQLDQILNNSKFLQPYIQDKLKQKSIAAAGKFIVHASDSEFDMAYMTLHHKLDQLNNPAFRKELELKKGFYWSADDTIHLRPLSNMSEALHEAIHKFSEMGFLSMFGKFVNEGTTQYFSDKVQIEMGLPPAESHGYGPELVFATNLISYLGESFTAEQYFKDFDGVTMLGKLGLTLVEYNEKYRFGEDAKNRFLRYLRKLI